MLNTLDSKTLMDHTKELVRRERLLCVKLISYIAEVDKRRLYADEGFPSMFRFLTEGLHYSEPAAHRRLAAARLSRRYPQTLAMLETGSMHLTGLSMLAQHLTAENCEKILALCAYKSKSQIEAIIVKEINGEQAFFHREIVRLVPAAPKAEMKATTETPTSQNALVNQLTKNSQPEPDVDVRLSLTLDKDSYEKLKRAQIIAGSETIAETLKQAIEFFLDHKDQTRKMTKVKKADPVNEKEQVSKEVPALSPAEADVPKTKNHIPIPTKRFVFKRDEGRCTYVNPVTERRCSETCRLELDHIIPRALNGTNDPANLRLRCKAHNLLAARQLFGTAFMEQKMREVQL